MGVTIVAAIALVVANVIVDMLYAVVDPRVRLSERPERGDGGNAQRSSSYQTSPSESKAFLSVRDLRVHFPTEDGLVKAVDGLSFDVNRGSILGIVGESGSGKSVTSQAILGLHTGSRTEITGEIWLDGKNLVGASEGEMRALRGAEIAMIFQDPLSSLHPFYKVGAQISEAYLVHNNVSRREARKRRAIEMLDRVGHPEPGVAVRRLPAPVLRRHAAARHDRDGARLRPEAAHRRRADHRAGRHRAGADPRADEGPAAGVRLRDHPDHPRPRRGR